MGEGEEEQVYSVHSNQVPVQEATGDADSSSHGNATLDTAPHCNSEAYSVANGNSSTDSHSRTNRHTRTNSHSRTNRHTRTDGGGYPILAQTGRACGVV